MQSNKPNRSDRYQDLYKEISFPDDKLSLFTNEHSPYSNQKEYSEEYLNLNDIVIKKIIEIITTDKKLTKRQREVLSLSASGMTQLEIATKFGNAQSTITKTLHGSAYYKMPGMPIHGGAAKKISKILLASKEFQSLIRQLFEMDE